MMGKRRAALVRMQRVIARTQAKQAPIGRETTQLDQARIGKWIRDRLTADRPGGCWHCRKPFFVGQKFVDVRGDEVVVRFHAECETEWRRKQEALARKALGLDRSERP